MSSGAAYSGTGDSYSSNTVSKWRQEQEGRTSPERDIGGEREKLQSRAKSNRRKRFIPAQQRSKFAEKPSPGYPPTKEDVENKLLPQIPGRYYNPGIGVYVSPMFSQENEEKNAEQKAHDARRKEMLNSDSSDSDDGLAVICCPTERNLLGHEAYFEEDEESEESGEESDSSNPTRISKHEQDKDVEGINKQLLEMDYEIGVRKKKADGDRPRRRKKKHDKAENEADKDGVEGAPRSEILSLDQQEDDFNLPPDDEVLGSSGVGRKARQVAHRKGHPSLVEEDSRRLSWTDNVQKKVEELRKKAEAEERHQQMSKWFAQKRQLDSAKGDDEEIVKPSMGTGLGVGERFKGPAVSDDRWWEFQWKNEERAASGDERDRLAYTRRPRDVKFKPYAMNDYRSMRASVPKSLGTLGPDLENPELVEKRMLRERLKEYEKMVHNRNFQVIDTTRRKVPATAIGGRPDRVGKGDLLRKAKEYAMGVPKPQTSRGAPGNVLTGRQPQASRFSAGGSSSARRWAANEPSPMSPNRRAQFNPKVRQNLDAQHKEDLARERAIRRELGLS